MIVGYDARRIIDLLVKQRGAPETRMRPIAVVGLDDHRSIDPLIEQLIDVLLPPHPNLEALLETGRTLDTLSRRLQRMSLKPGDEVLTLLQFLYSRNQTAEPVIDANAPMAYDYPLAAVLMATPGETALHTLNDLARHNMLESNRIDRVFVCPDCHTYRVPVKELCTECHSPNLSLDDSIHHFRCGYVAPEKDFMTHGKPICPKCHSALRHIGVEYNRPGHFSVCHDCGHWSSEPELRAWCVACNAYHWPGDLVPIHIKRFRLGENGIQVAQAGSWDPNAVPTFDSRTAEEATIPVTREPDYTKDLTRLLISVAANNRDAMTLYRVNLAPAAAQDAALLGKVGSLLHDQVGDPDLAAQIEAGAFVMALPQGNADGPDAARIKRLIAHKLGADVSVVALDPDKTAELLAQA